MTPLLLLLLSMLVLGGGIWLLWASGVLDPEFVLSALFGSMWPK